MREVWVDIKKNRLYLDVGDVEPARMESVLQEVGAACERLVFGFTCIPIFRKGNAISPENEDHILKVQDLLYSKGCSRVVRVREKDMEMEQIQYEMVSLKHGYDVEYAESLEDAEAILDNLPAE